jgi:UTP:GlnB (protein PII) uridylyltransferase
MAYTKPELRESIKNRIMSGSKGGNPGQWSARKAQLLAQAYKKAGGGYSGAKTTKQKSLSKWTKEKWGTKSGRPSTQGAKATGERYLPKKARESLTAKEYAATSRAKREGTSQGKQFVRQPKKIAKKTARYR